MLTVPKEFKFKNPLYALDASIFDLSLSVFEWAKFRRTKGGIKLHNLFDIRSQIPVFNVITPAKESEVTVAKNTDFRLSPDSRKFQVKKASNLTILLNFKTQNNV